MFPADGPHVVTPDCRLWEEAGALLCWGPSPTPSSPPWGLGRELGVSTRCLLVEWADPHQAPNLADSFWNPNAFETDSDLPAGWMRVQDTSGTYYWHIPTGTTQWEPPGRASPSQESSPREESQVRLTGLLFFGWGRRGICCWSKMSPHSLFNPSS